MRVLAGGPARETESAVFGLHRAGLEANGDVQIRHEVVKDPGGPRWHHTKLESVAGSRQRFLDDARASYDALWMVDTDVVCGPGVLDRMMEVDAPIVFGVFWTHADWGGSRMRWPQVWWTHPYWALSRGEGELGGDCWAGLVADGVNEVPVLGGGACTLIRGEGLDCRYWPLLESLRGSGGMWFGEDRRFCLEAEIRGLDMVAVTGLPIVHLHDIDTPEAIAAAKEWCGL